MKVKVTQNDIDEGIHYSAFRCPIALALRRKPFVKHVLVTNGERALMRRYGRERLPIICRMRLRCSYTGSTMIYRSRPVPTRFTGNDNMSKLTERTVGLCDWPRLAQAIVILLTIGVSIVVALGTLGWLITHYPTIASVAGILGVVAFIVYLIYDAIR